MIFDDIHESAKAAWGKSGDKVVKKFRCTTGQRKGRLVTSPEKCSTPVDIKKRFDTKKQMNRFGSRYARKAKRTKKNNPASRIVKARNMAIGECFIVENKLQKYDYNIIKGFATVSGLSEKESETFIKSVPLSIYADIVDALEIGDEKRLTDIAIEYAEKDYSDTSIKAANESVIFSDNLSKAHITKLTQDYRIVEAYDVLIQLSESDIKDFCGKWLNEGVEYPQSLDVAIHKYIFENITNPQLRQNIQRLSQKPATVGKTPTFNKQEIVSANANDKTLAVKNDKGEIETHKIDNINKKDIAFEEAEILKKLAGI